MYVIKKYCAKFDGLSKSVGDIFSFFRHRDQGSSPFFTKACCWMMNGAEQKKNCVSIFNRIQEDISEHSVVLYMKGSALFPQCGFSAAVVQILDNLGISYKDIDILFDEELRQGIKDFTNWPTIPQLYVAGRFVGGADLVREMYATGELQHIFCQYHLL